jgi:hypothetical protein
MIVWKMERREAHILPNSHALHVLRPVDIKAPRPGTYIAGRSGSDVFPFETHPGVVKACK